MNKERIEKLENKVSNLIMYKDRLLDDIYKLKLIVEELMRLNGLMQTCFSNSKDIEEIREKYELLHEKDGWSLWGKRKK